MTACSRYSKRPDESGQLTITVSIEPLRYFVEHIAGPDVKVVSIVPEGYSPETYKPTPKQLMELSNSKLYFEVGDLGFETTWLGEAISEQPHLKIIDTSDSLRKSQGGIQLSSFDPHTWTSAAHARVIAATICQALCEADTAHQATYRHNLTTLLDTIAATEAQIHALLAHTSHRTFITVHPALTYFAEEYGLRQLCIERDGKQSSPIDLATLIRQSREEHVRVILVQREFSHAQAEAVSRETGARIVSINPLGYDWPREMVNIAKACLQ